MRNLTILLILGSCLLLTACFPEDAVTLPEAVLISSDEFQINTYSTSAQYNSSTAMDANGNFVVTWSAYGQDGDNYGIYAQRYDLAGVAQSTEFQVNTYTANEQSQSSAAMDANGNFVVTWTSEFQDGDGDGIYAQRYDSAGIAQGAEFKVNTYTTGAQVYPSTAMDANGNFMVTWMSQFQDGDGYGIYAQRYDSAGIAQGTEFQVNTYTTSNQSIPSTAMDANGNFVVTWHSDGQDGDSYGIYAQRYDSLGVVQGVEFLVNTYTIGSQITSGAAMDANGNFVVTWHSFDQDGDGTGIYGQRYDSLGVVQGVEFQVNTYTTNYQQAPSVAMGDTGNFVVAWMSGGQDGDGNGIYAQRYDSAGVVQGAEFLVNTYTASNQNFSSTAMDANSNFVVTWQSFSQDGDGWGVYGKHYYYE